MEGRGGGSETGASRLHPQAVQGAASHSTHRLLEIYLGTTRVCGSHQEKGPDYRECSSKTLEKSDIEAKPHRLS